MDTEMPLSSADLLVSLQNFPNGSVWVALLYLSLSGLYLLVLPGFLYLYLNKRWYTASSIERVVMYFFVFFLFPGLLLMSPFLNFRPRRA